LVRHRISGETANHRNLQADGFGAQCFLAEIWSSADALAAVKPGNDMCSHLQLPGANRVDPHNAIREMVERAWTPDRRLENSLSEEVGEVRVAVYRAGAAYCNRYRRGNLRRENLHLVCATWN